jgi:hypothetical protein
MVYGVHSWYVVYDITLRSYYNKLQTFRNLDVLVHQWCMVYGGSVWCMVYTAGV